MTIARDYTGQVYARLTAIRRIGDRGGKWLFSCECGNETVTNIARVRIGMTKSCGCLALESVRARSITHGHSLGRRASRTLCSYRAAVARCYNEKNSRYPTYGKLGVTMCDRWLNSFEAFLEDMGERPQNTSLDRIDATGNYEPGNCQWASPLEQGGNKRKTIRVEHKGESYSLRRFASVMCVPYKSLYKRVVLSRQDPLAAAKAMLEPLPAIFEGQRMSVRAYARCVGVEYKSLHRKIRRERISPEEAAAGILARRR